MKTLLAATTCALLILSVTGCSTAIRTANTEPAPFCGVLDWDGCAVAPNCRPARAWQTTDGVTDETYACVSIPWSTPEQPSVANKR